VSEPTVRLESFGRGGATRSFSFSGFQSEIVARSAEEVRTVLEEAERATASGLHAAGYVCYEAAAGLDASLKTATDTCGLPLVWFGVFEDRDEVEPASDGCDASWRPVWSSSISRERYDADIDAIRALIEAGDTYQVNHTFRMHTSFDADGWGLYRSLCQAQKADYCAYIDTGTHQVLSASPELFFSLKEGRLLTRPMKGTHKRGRWCEEDEAFRDVLANSEKNRAENLMIVDLLRNDLGRVCETGSVTVSDLWQVEAYETLFQMTSTVEGQVGAGVGLTDVFSALFPCGSVTGAPKVRTMEIISEVESDPRGVYTGAIGYASPGGEACFNVAIRTVCVDREQRRAVFGVGGAITWDSTSDDEYAECVTKARVLTEQRPDFYLFETMRYDPDEGMTFLDRHLRRLSDSATYFGFPCEVAEVTRVVQAAENACDRASRVRLILEADGNTRFELAELTASRPYTAAISPIPVDSADVFLYHKTSNRQMYDRCRKAVPDVDDVILMNERGELTEFTIGNLVLELEGERVTPARSSGLLGGTFRQELLESGEIFKRVLMIDDLQQARNVYMINSVREWVPVTVKLPSTEREVGASLAAGS